MDQELLKALEYMKRNTDSLQPYVYSLNVKSQNDEAAEWLKQNVKGYRVATHNWEDGTMQLMLFREEYIADPEVRKIIETHGVNLN